jgi:leader peptidase (prepilin peptidase) / N-methyltransferase
MNPAPTPTVETGQFPLREAAALAVAYAAMAVPAGLELAMPRSVVLVSVGLAVVLIALSVIDLKSFRLPDVLTLPLVFSGIALAGVLGWDTFGWRAASAAIGFGSAFLVARIYEAVRGRSGLGLGDAKLFAASGAWVGAAGLASVVLYACAAALIALLVARLRNESLSMSTAIPFGPFLAAGTWLVWLYGPLA